MVCRLFIKIKMRNNSVKEQIQLVLSYIQRISADIWKKNIMKDLESESLSYAMVREFLLDLKEDFGGGDDKIIKVAELKNMEQEKKMIKEFVPEFRRAAKKVGIKRDY